MDHGGVADGHVPPDHQRHAQVGVQHAVVLHIAVLTDRDGFVVAAKHCAEPYAGVVLQNDIADHDGAGSDPVFIAVRHPRSHIIETVFHCRDLRDASMTSGLTPRKGGRMILVGRFGGLDPHSPSRVGHSRPARPPERRTGCRVRCLGGETSRLHPSPRQGRQASHLHPLQSIIHPKGGPPRLRPFFLPLRRTR